MARHSEGDRVRIDIPDETDPDHEQLHGRHGTITAVFEDNADLVTGNEGDARLYTVELDSGEAVDLREQDLRPPLE